MAPAIAHTTTAVEAQNAQSLSDKVITITGEVEAISSSSHSKTMWFRESANDDNLILDNVLNKN